MKLGVYLPVQDATGHWLSGRELGVQAQVYEEAGIDSGWLGDHLPLPGDTGRNLPDPFMWLLLAAQATTDLELGTCAFCVPLRTPYDVAQRLCSLQSLFPDRFTIGVATGSQEREYEANGLVWDERFSRLRDHMDKIRGVFEGRVLGDLEGEQGLSRSDPGAKTWAQEVGPPRLLLGAWHSAPQLRRAATEYDGWMASGSPGTRFGGWRKVLTEGIETYRSFGGKRAMVVNILCDLSAPTTPLADDGFFSLRCDPDEAARRLQILADLGYDDIVLRPTKPGAIPSAQVQPTRDELAAIRALIPKG